ncbi:Fatty acid hydroxylase family protein [Angomonas deanei]|uniref:Cytochrome b5-like Heme/Steroid binding domain/Fatty acid hydroxylase superfamily, putative n=1 Tax=Angomonas deanei TaxID=59799 RepID=A0A7G2CV59_9TRYP|nr:Fatty acid hydroxylase family protein [Angomonas deanei]CAD2222961.1 Cytochrome b5-like Heme/Steroid binding domain/Fatty acid hydroxylase superfamily, putative [Angomonas deanei]|eukprot:EPY36366.1 Fatty acid hydroxylase family protein [Angomonas deanei]
MSEEKLFTVDNSTGELIFASPVAFQKYADNLEKTYLDSKHPTGNRPIWFLYKGTIFNCTDFIAHPGGADILHKYNGKDITVTFHDEYNEHGHTGSALNMMLQYKAGRVQREMKKCAIGDDDNRYNEYEMYGLEELTAYPKITETEIIYKNFTIARDKGLIWQAMFLPFEDYLHLISVPIYLPYCQLFDTPLFEPFSKTKYYLIMILWLPLSFFWLVRGVLKDNSQVWPQYGSMFDRFLYYPNQNLIFHNYPAVNSNYIPDVHQFNNQTSIADTIKEISELQYQHAKDISYFSFFNVALVWAAGVLLWTFMEYFIHRYPFHFERALPPHIMEFPLCKWLHLLLHGIHHIIPMDPDRLVFPPALFVVASFLIYNFYGFLFTGSFLDILASGVVFGYVCYDVIHYLIHHIDPKDFYLKDLKKYHHAHHFVDDRLGYGISSKLWDLVFGTACRKN